LEYDATPYPSTPFGGLHVFQSSPGGDGHSSHGTPEETKHLILRNKQAVLSPSWSIHAGVATQAYSFIWGMGGEKSGV